MIFGKLSIKSLAVGPILQRLVGLGADADEFEEAGGGAEDDAADEAPGGRAEPFVDEPARGAKGDDGGEEGDARRVSEAGFAVLVLVGVPGHQLSRVR